MNCQNPNRCTVRRCCQYVGAALCFLVLVLAFTVGLILGAVFYESILPALAAVIAFAAAILAIVIALLIYWFVNRHN